MKIYKYVSSIDVLDKIVSGLTIIPSYFDGVNDKYELLPMIGYSNYLVNSLREYLFMVSVPVEYHDLIVFLSYCSEDNYKYFSCDLEFSTDLAHSLELERNYVGFDKRIEDAESKEDVSEAFREMVSRYFHMSCFSRKNDNSLMWAHYGNNHKGFCIEFDADLIKKHVSKYAYLDKVVYTAERRNISLGDDYIFDLFFEKDSRWAYEQEYRLVFPHYNTISHGLAGERPFIKIPNESITGIVFGLDASKEDINYVERNYSDLDLFDLQLDNTSFDFIVERHY